MNKKTSNWFYCIHFFIPWRCILFRLVFGARRTKKPFHAIQNCTRNFKFGSHKDGVPNSTELQNFALKKFQKSFFRLLDIYCVSMDSLSLFKNQKVQKFICYRTLIHVDSIARNSLRENFPLNNPWCELNRKVKVSSTKKNPKLRIIVAK